MALALVPLDAMEARISDSKSSAICQRRGTGVAESRANLRRIRCACFNCHSFLRFQVLRAATAARRVAVAANAATRTSLRMGMALAFGLKRVIGKKKGI